MTFWEHLEELRGCFIRILLAVALGTVVAFCCKDILFALVFAPKSPDFITYRLFKQLFGAVGVRNIDLVNINLAQQFLIHMKVSLWMGILATSPYILYVLFHFMAPGLYRNERRYALCAVGGGYVMFLLGVLLNYFVIFPFTFQFLGTYQVHSDVANIISLESYVSMLLMLCFLMGVVFELPVLCWLLSKLGLLHADTLRLYRRHAVVVIVIVAAVITPTGDPFTLSLVALPIYLLYEISIFVVRTTVERGKATSLNVVEK